MYVHLSHFPISKQRQLTKTLTALVLTCFLSLFQSTVTSQTSLLISERIVYVNEHFSRTLHHSICRALFNTDRQLFTVLLAFAALRSKVDMRYACIDTILTRTMIHYMSRYRVMSSKKRLIDCTRKPHCLQVIGLVHLGLMPKLGNILWN